MEDPKGAGVSESDVANSDGDGVGPGVARLCVFAHPQEIIKGNVGQVCCGVMLWTVVWSRPVSVEEVLSDGDGHCELG